MPGFANDYSDGSPQSVLFCNNIDFTGTSATTGSAQVSTNGQLLIGSTASPHIKIGHLTSTDGSITVTNGSGTINLAVSSPTSITYTEDTGTAAPSMGNLNVFGNATQGVATSGSGSTVTITVGNATTAQRGVSYYNAANFTLASGQVSSNAITVTGGVGISVSGSPVNLGGTVTITATGSGIAWSDKSTSFNAVVSNGYFCTAALTATLPGSPSEGDRVAFVVDTASAVIVQGNTGQFIRLGASISASAGTITSSAIGDSLQLVYRSSSTTWYTLSAPQGLWVVT